MIAVRIVFLCSLLFIVAGCGSSDDRVAAPSKSNEIPYSVAPTGPCQNEWIVFARDNDIWRLRPNGSDIQLVVDLPAGAQVIGIALSPDASQLAYLEYYGEFSTSNRVVLVDIDGSNLQTLVPTGGNGASGVCDFHPDGTRVMYYRDIVPGGGQNYELYEVCLDSTCDINLTNHPNNDGGGSYSPTGDQIAFHSGRAFSSRDVSIYTQNHDGTGRTEIFDRCGDSDNTTVWSPDGARILVSSRCPGEEEDLYLIDPDGSNPVQLTNTFGVRERHKAWSPDGNRIVFERSGNLYFIDRDGSGEVLFLNNATWPDWASFCPIPALVSFDIKPGSCPNPINPKSQGKLPAAILGTGDFDVTEIDVSSLLLEGVAPIRSSIEDVTTPFVGHECDCTEEGPDGYDDLTLKFMTQEIVAALAPVSPGDEKVLTITGTLLDGTPFEASDCVVVVGGKKNPPFASNDL